MPVADPPQANQRQGRGQNRTTTGLLEAGAASRKTIHLKPVPFSVERMRLGKPSLNPPPFLQPTILYGVFRVLGVPLTPVPSLDGASSGARCHVNEPQKPPTLVRVYVHAAHAVVIGTISRSGSSLGCVVENRTTSLTATSILARFQPPNPPSPINTHFPWLSISHASQCDPFIDHSRVKPR